MDSEDEGFYDSGGSDDGAADSASEDNEADYTADVRIRQKPYKILTEDDIRRHHDDDISTVSDVLSVSRDTACSLLCRNNWSLSSVYDRWFADTDRTNTQSTAANSAQRELGQQVCNICYDEITSENSVSAACGHPFCSDCWKAYIATAISGGPGCLTLSCPEPGCGAAVGVELVESLASEEEKDKYYKYLRRSYVELSRRRKWCPAPGCCLAVEFDLDCGGGGGGGGYDTTCGCGHKFCWKCTAELHRPVDCVTVASWTEKNNSEEENTKWILAYTKPCPKCCRPIEKNQGCSHMTCGSPCGFRFCWLCLQSLNSHVRCISYDNVKQRESDMRREKAMKCLQRYMHYYERWHTNEQSRKVAMTDLRRWRDEYASKLRKMQGELAECEVQFVGEAWEQIVECRRVLKWSYAFGYYLDGEGWEKKRSLFEYLQGEAETGLERLHHCAEKEMMGYLGCYEKDFRDFRGKLIGLTAVTKNYFENLVKALENNLAEVGSTTSTSTSQSDDSNTPRKRSCYAATYSGKQ